MGTNYFARWDICSECGRYEQVHIGQFKVRIDNHKEISVFKFNNACLPGYMNHEEYRLNSFDKWSQFLRNIEVKVYAEDKPLKSLEFWEFFNRVKACKEYVFTKTYFR